MMLLQSGLRQLVNCFIVGSKIIRINLKDCASKFWKLMEACEILSSRGTETVIISK